MDVCTVLKVWQASQPGRKLDYEIRIKEQWLRVNMNGKMRVLKRRKRIGGSGLFAEKFVHFLFEPVSA